MSAHVHIYSIWVTMMAEFWRVNFPKWQSSMIQKWNTWRWCNGFQRSLQSNHSSSLPLPGFLGPNESWFFTLWGVLRPSSQSSQEAITRTRFLSFKQIHRWSRWSGCLIGMPGWCIMIIPIMWGSRRPKLLVNWSPKICQSAQTNRCRHSKSCRNLGTGKEHPPTKWPRALLYCNEKKRVSQLNFVPVTPNHRKFLRYSSLLLLRLRLRLERDRHSQAINLLAAPQCCNILQGYLQYFHQ